MTACVIDAVRAAERQFYRRDDPHWAEIYGRRARVQALTRAGMSSAQIGVLIDMSERNVVRARSQPLPERPRIVEPHVSDERAAELEQIADAAVDLACRIRDEDPAVVWDALSRLDRRQLQELTVIILAAMPMDRNVRELFAWVTDLPTAKAAHA